MLIAAFSGVTVANLYLAHPILSLIGSSFGVTGDRAELVVTVGQVGYTAGLFFVIPLGDVQVRNPVSETPVTRRPFRRRGPDPHRGTSAEGRTREVSRRSAVQFRVLGPLGAGNLPAGTARVRVRRNLAQHRRDRPRMCRRCR